MNKNKFLIFLIVFTILLQQIIVYSSNVINTIPEIDMIPYNNNYNNNYNNSIQETTPVIANDDVVIGSDNWLFYNMEDTENVKQDYLGTNLFTPFQLEFYLKELIKIRDDLRSKGIKFVLYFAPNKNRVYSEYYPKDIGIMSMNYRLRQFIEYVRENSDIPIIYTYEHLLDAKLRLPGKILYHKYDTHWNNIGGYVGAYDFLYYFGVQIPYVNDSRLTIEETEGGSYELFYIGRIENVRQGDVEYTIHYDNEPTSEYSTIIDNGMAQYTSNNPKLDKHIFVLCDSYFANMMGHIGNVTKKLTFCMHTKFNRLMLYNYKPDIFAVEILERQLENRLNHLIITYNN